MSTPFDRKPSTATATVALATEPQLRRALKPMLADRDWANAGLAESWVNRIAAIATSLNVAELSATDDRLIEQLDIALTDRTDLAQTFAELMAFCFAHAVSDETDPSAYKPLTKAGASKLIDLLGTLSFKAGQASQVEEANVAAAKAAVKADREATQDITAEVVPAGRYAVDTEDGAVNELAFYRVDRPTEGRWAGFVFVKLITGDDEQRLSQAAGKAILRKIAAAGAAEASARYGHEIGECGVCGRQLTNDESRAAGIGPVCRDRLGW